MSLHATTAMPARIVGLLVLCLAIGCSGGGGETGGEPTVVVLVIEALRHDYADRVEAPALARMAREGARAEKLIPVFPTNSLPNLAAIATGHLPSGSGIVNNLFYDRAQDRRFEGDPEGFDAMRLAEPLWVSARRQGIPVGAINWSGAPTDRRIGRSGGLEDDADDASRVDELIAWLGEDGPEAPRLILAYLDELDDLAHDEGPDSSGTLEAVATYDRHVGRILDAMSRDRSTLLVLGDHGMAHVEHVIYLRAFLEERGIDAYPLGLGGSANIYLDAGVNAENTKATLERDGPAFTVHLPDDLPSGYGYAAGERVGDLVLIGRPGTYFRNLGRKSEGAARLPGMHGFEPEMPEMAAGLFAWGRGVTPGTAWGDVSMVDVYPTVCRLLGIDPGAGIDGKLLPQITVERASR